MDGHTFELELGRVDLVSTTSGLRLQLTSEAEVTTFSGDLETLTELITTCSLPCPERAWLSLRHGFRLTIRLQLPDCDRNEQESLAEQLALRLWNNSLWQQLQLEPMAKEMSWSATESCMLLQFFLDHRQQIPDNTRCKAHKLKQDVYARDIQPPPGVPKAEISQVKLSMAFTNPETSKRKKINCLKIESNHGKPEFAPHEQSFTAGASLQHVQGTRRTRTTPEKSTPRTEQSRASVARESEHPGKFCRAHLRPGLKRCLSTGDVISGMKGHVIAALPLLFDAGLRYSIAAPLTCSTKDVQVDACESLKQLAEICPGGFSPGFLEALASREAYLPTVSHAMSSIAAVHARSQTLRNKLRELARRDGVTVLQHISMSTMQESLAGQLWRCLTASLQSTDRTLRTRSMIHNNREQPSKTLEIATLEEPAFCALGLNEPEALRAEGWHCCCGNDDCSCLPDRDLDQIFDEDWHEFLVEDLASASEGDSRAEDGYQYQNLQARDGRVADEFDDEAYSSYGSETSRNIEETRFLGAVPDVALARDIRKDTGLLMELDLDTEDILAIE
ncbi:hypothetical protein CERZMDRAFT_100764 [Cercospora zeae-maydis SCOH1-5]|uniref:Uncharacterized protein n=1 Tax=Cercospora zeae-maydis SCOH1-5 TaxID=717836 RepID=A0A6A6F3H3_9PEZI|nr:hypothetical protein CERZMDRAFT_100764 [Cercospora zeae-maydis SCOH1-5]